jgi:3'-phosphoadenosine 5'-phosphosulfate sulfotransferase (PAPS reductase)/FAD synthetase
MFHEIYDFWQANPHIWFNSTPADDFRITELFEDALQHPDPRKPSSLPIKEFTGYVILHDQLRRHINRATTGQPYPEPADFIQQCYAGYSIYSSEFTDFEFMFVLMPLRHAHLLQHVKFVLAETWKRIQHPATSAESRQTLKKYLTATYERYIKYSPDRDKSSLVTYQPELPTQLAPNPAPSFIYILDPEIKDSYILQNSWIEPPASLTDNTKLIQQMSSFLGKLPSGSTITVSLSGGVDSMVCTYLLKAVGQPFQAVHINYANRPECPLEVALLRYWCSILDVPLIIRTIDEINRPRCMEPEINLRELYESYTRDIRMLAYINSKPPFFSGEASQKGTKIDSMRDFSVNGTSNFVILGHNQDDTIENILTNIASSSHLENLLGMTPISSQMHFGEEIRFLRPLLNTTKQEIYEFAHLANIPYLIDSTPKWSRFRAGHS